jgi:hypothetical protein
VTLEAVDDEALAAALTSLLQQLVDVNESAGLVRTCDEVEERLRVFFSRHLQPFPLDSYVGRVVGHMPSRPVLVLALAYIDRLFEAHNDMALAPANMHRVFTVAVLLAYKFLEDEPCSQDFFRTIGGIPSLQELNDLEAEFLHQIRWRASVEPSLFHSYMATVLDRVDALRQRGDALA